MEENKENILTYEVIFELLRKERGSEALQKIDDGFYTNIVDYIKEKSAGDEKELILNIKKILKELYERREKKIIGLGLDKARLGIEVMNTSNMLKEERWIFERIVTDLQDARVNILERIFALKEPELTTSNISLSPVHTSQNEGITPLKSEDIIPQEPQNENTLVRFLHAVPRFVGRELEIYGPFVEEEITTLPKEIANLLISKGRAEEIKNN